MTEKDIKTCGHGSGNPSIKNLYTYTSQRYAKKAPNGVHKGIACVKRLKAIDDAGRERYLRAYNRIVGRNVYSQNRRSYVNKKYSNGKYYSDCSSSQMWALQEAGYKTGGLLNTAGIYHSDLFETVPVVIKNGHIANPEVLKVADQILYIGNDPSRPKQIGHVEGVYYVPAAGSSGYPGTWPSLSNGRSDSTGHGYYKLGDGIDTLTNYPTQIKRVQALLNWINDGKISVDGKFGTQTRKACDAAQKRLGLMVTGIFDYSLLKAAKKHFK